MCSSQVYGEQVLIIGPKKFLCAAVSPPSARQHVQHVMQLCFDQPCKLLPNFLCLTLTPSNQIIHPARCAYSAGIDTAPGVPSQRGETAAASGPFVHFQVLLYFQGVGRAPSVQSRGDFVGSVHRVRRRSGRLASGHGQRTPMHQASSN